MKLHIWDDDKNPPIVEIEVGDEYVKVLDFPWWVGYEVGDQIQYQTALGTQVYFVVEVAQEYNDFDGITSPNVVLLEAVS